MRATRLRVAALAAMILGAALAGCSTAQGPRAGTSADPSGSPSDAASGGTPAATAAPDKPAMVAGGSAAENKAFFDSVGSTVFASAASANGKTIIDALAAAGFDKASMQVTPDKTSDGGAVDSILFSVRLGGQCLLGQRGSDGFSSAVQPALANGGCLVGKTRPIDW